MRGPYEVDHATTTPKSRHCKQNRTRPADVSRGSDRLPDPDARAYDSRGAVRTITDDAFEVPTTVARWGNRLATVNVKFDSGFPPTAATFEVVEVSAN
jgi:hypothetical protein